MDSLLTTQATSTGKDSRFTPASKDAQTTEIITRNGKSEIVNGRVYAGKDRAARAFLVHDVKGTEQSIPLHAVATSIASGAVFTPLEVAAIFAETGTLHKLAAAVAKLTPAEEPPAK